MVNSKAELIHYGLVIIKCQATIWTNADQLTIELLWTNFNQNK